MLSSLLHLVAMPADDSPTLDIPALAHVPAVDDSSAVADGSTAAAGVLPLPLPLLLPKTLSFDFFTVFAAAEVYALSDVIDDAAV
jgi:hypothetical protein